MESNFWDVAGLIGTATAERNGLMNKTYANTNILLQPNNSFEIKDIYSVICLREVSEYGLVAIVFSLWSEIRIIESGYVIPHPIEFTSNKKGGIIITNTGDAAISLNIRRII